MTLADRLRHLHDEKLRVHLLFTKLDRALSEQRITFDEYRYFLMKTFGGKQEHEILREMESEEQRIHAEMRKPKRITPILAIILVAALVAVAIHHYAPPAPAAMVVESPAEPSPPPSDTPDDEWELLEPDLGGAG